MHLVKTDDNSALLKSIIPNESFGTKQKENQDHAVYLFRSQITELSLLGSDLIIEPYDGCE